MKKLIVLTILLGLWACDDAQNNNSSNDLPETETLVQMKAIPAEGDVITIYDPSNTGALSWENGIKLSMPEGTAAAILTFAVSNNLDDAYPVYFGSSTDGANYHMVENIIDKQDVFGNTEYHQSIFINLKDETDFRIWTSTQYGTVNGFQVETMVLSVIPQIWFIQ